MFGVVVLLGAIVLEAELPWTTCLARLFTAYLSRAALVTRAGG